MIFDTFIFDKQINAVVKASFSQPMVLVKVNGAFLLSWKSDAEAGHDVIPKLISSQYLLGSAPFNSTQFFGGFH